MWGCMRVCGTQPKLTTAPLISLPLLEMATLESSQEPHSGFRNLSVEGPQNAQANCSEGDDARCGVQNNFPTFPQSHCF